MPMKTLLKLILLIVGMAEVAAQPLPDVLASAAPIVSAHRGGFYDALPENSMAAFAFTVKSAGKLMMLEFDLRRSKDGTLYIMHDASVDRTTNGTGNLTDLSDGYVRQLYLRDANGKITRERVPTFSELLRWAKEKPVLLMLDIKGDVWSEAISLVNEYGVSSRCLVLTFTRSDAQRVRSMDRSIALSSLVTSEKDWIELKAQLSSLGPVLAYVNEGAPETLIRQIIESGIRLLSDVSEHTKYQGRVLTTKEYLDAVHRIGNGVLVSDYPLAALQALREP
jgi:glycerophosphoryl diester phosphodiesterase